MLHHVPSEPVGTLERPQKGKRRWYSDKDRADALAVLQAEGGNYYATSKKLGISRQVLASWADATGNPDSVHQPIAPLEVIQASKRDYAEHLVKARWAYADQMMDPVKIKETSGYYAAVTTKILTEQHALLTGNATSRVELSLASFLGSVGALPGGSSTNPDGGVGAVEVLPISPTSTPEQRP